MSGQVGKCIGVVDGAMLILEGGQTVTLSDVRVPRVGIPGGAVLRTFLQRLVQDKHIVYHEVKRDHLGYMAISARVDDLDIGPMVNQALKDYGYAP